MPVLESVSMPDRAGLPFPTSPCSRHPMSSLIVILQPNAKREARELGCTSSRLIVVDSGGIKTTLSNPEIFWDVFRHFLAVALAVTSFFASPANPPPPISRR